MIEKQCKLRIITKEDSFYIITKLPLDHLFSAKGFLQLKDYDKIKEIENIKNIDKIKFEHWII